MLTLIAHVVFAYVCVMSYAICLLMQEGLYFKIAMFTISNSKFLFWGTKIKWETLLELPASVTLCL